MSQGLELIDPYYSLVPPEPKLSQNQGFRSGAKWKIAQGPQGVGELMFLKIN